jgi:hypothetical protein
MKIFEKSFYPRISRIDANYEGGKQKGSAFNPDFEIGGSTGRASDLTLRFGVFA